MRKVAAEIDKINALIPASSESSIALVAITKTETSGFRLANGRGLIEIETKENWVATAAHEGGHAVLDHHLRSGGTGGKGAGILPLRMADLYKGGRDRQSDRSHHPAFADDDSLPIVGCSAG